jgi:hypothetical protein
MRDLLMERKTIFSGGLKKSPSPTPPYKREALVLHSGLSS